MTPAERDGIWMALMILIARNYVPGEDRALRALTDPKIDEDERTIIQLAWYLHSGIAEVRMSRLAHLHPQLRDAVMPLVVASICGRETDMISWALAAITEYRRAIGPQGVH